jgi:hypothetical protein
MWFSCMCAAHDAGAETRPPHVPAHRRGFRAFANVRPTLMPAPSWALLVGSRRRSCSEILERKADPSVHTDSRGSVNHVWTAKTLDSCEWHFACSLLERHMARLVCSIVAMFLSLSLVPSAATQRPLSPPSPADGGAVAGHGTADRPPTLSVRCVSEAGARRQCAANTAAGSR